MAAGFLLVLVAGDAILSRIPWPDLYGSRNLSHATWERFERSSESYDVLYLGCSYEWYGINPRVVDAEVARLGGPNIKSLNLSSSAASVVTNYLIARRVVESGRLPKIVYLDISPDATDVTQHNWIRHGLRSLGEARDLPIAASIGSDVLLETLLCATFRSYGRWDDAGIVAGRAVLAAPLNPKLKMRLGRVGRRRARVATTAWTTGRRPPWRRAGNESQARRKCRGPAPDGPTAHERRGRSAVVGDAHVKRGGPLGQP
jgi:hypothetical protein